VFTGNQGSILPFAEVNGGANTGAQDSCIVQPAVGLISASRKVES
jgi:hypothetical protein